MSKKPLPIPEIAENARELEAIELIDLVTIMAEDKRYAEILPDLWEAYNLDAAHRFPHNVHPEGNLSDFRIRHGAWFWLLARFAGTSEEEGFYFKGLPKRKLLPVYDLRDGKFTEVQGTRDFDQYVKLEDWKGFLEHIQRRYKLDVHLPWRLFGDAIGQSETDLPRTSSHSSDHQSRVDLAQAGIDRHRVMSLAMKGLAFTRGPKHDRLDNLSKAMKKAWKAFVKEQKEIPTCFQVWDWIPEEGIILEKESDTQTIHWKRSDGTETRTSYRSFQNRYSLLKKKLTSK